jgi:peptide deformylase
MKKEDIIALPHPNLRQKSLKVTMFGSSIKAMVKNMIEATLNWEDSRPHEIGAALAAVQINHLQRAIIVRSDFDDKVSREFTTLINPKIIKLEGDITYDHEGCLSVKDIYGLTPRYSRVRIKAQDLNGDDIRVRAEGFLARVLQHEVDHTNGILFIDHIKKNKDAFFTLDEKGELQKLDYEKDIATNRILWD